MKHAVALLCIFAIALNTAMAGLGSLLVCLHEDGVEHAVSSVSTYTAAHDDCCHATPEHRSQSTSLQSACDSCIDIEIEAAELENASLNLSRTLVKAPALIAWTPFALAWIAPVATAIEEPPAPRAQPVVERAVVEYSDTVQLRC